MVYFSAIIISSLLALLEVSFLPHFKIFDIVPFITLGFFCLVSVRFRGLSFIPIIFVTGMFFDYLSVSPNGIFTLVFFVTSIIGHFVLYRDSGYNYLRSFFLLFLISVVVLYLLNISPILIKDTTTWIKLVLPLIVVILSNFLAGLILVKTFDRYIDWINKQSEERYR